MPDHIDLPGLDWTETLLEPEIRITKGGKTRPPTGLFLAVCCWGVRCLSG